MATFFKNLFRKLVTICGSAGLSHYSREVSHYFHHRTSFRNLEASFVNLVPGSAERIGVNFLLGLANLDLPANFLQRILPANFSREFFSPISPRFRPPKKFTLKIHAQNCRHSSTPQIESLLAGETNPPLISQKCFTPIFFWYSGSLYGNRALEWY